MRTTNLKSPWLPELFLHGRGYFPGLSRAEVDAEFEIAETRKWAELVFPEPKQPLRPLRKHLVTAGLYVDADAMIWNYLPKRGWVFLSRVALCEYMPGRGGFFENLILPQLWVRFKGFENVMYLYRDYVHICVMESWYQALRDR